MIILDNKGNPNGDHNVSGDLGETEAPVVESQDATIEDIVIPDDLGEIPVTEDKKAEEMPF